MDKKERGSPSRGNARCIKRSQSASPCICCGRSRLECDRSPRPAKEQERENLISPSWIHSGASEWWAAGVNEKRRRCDLEASAWLLPHLRDADGANLDGPAALDNIDGGIGDRSRPQVLQHVSRLKPSKLHICAWEKCVSSPESAWQESEEKTRILRGKAGTCVLVVPDERRIALLEVGSRGSLCEVLKNMLKQEGDGVWSMRDATVRAEKHRGGTFTLSTQSMFRCSGMVVIHSPLVRRRNIPFSAASHMLYSPKFWAEQKTLMPPNPGIASPGTVTGRCNDEETARIHTSSRTLLSLPLTTTTVVFGSLQRALRGSFSSGCNFSSISLIWSPPLLPGVSTGSVNVALKPCSRTNGADIHHRLKKNRINWFPPQTNK